GVLQNYKEAINWIEKAARAGYVKAQYELGNIYRFKSGVENDTKRAYLWFTLAAGQGSMEAAIGRDQVETRLKPEEIAALQEEAGRIITESR
ncbi:MAG: sel1 repeat family protein, partial [Methylovulum sp.]|nr:sel1 repeat family protein [Methylovulum sp.]